MNDPSDPIEMSPADEATARALVNDDGTMKRPYAMVYVQHSIIMFLESEAVGYRSVAGDESKDAVDRADAKLCADICDETARQLGLANTAALAQQQMVQPIRVVGAVPPPRTRQ